MGDHPTSAQYRLGVELARITRDYLAAGMPYGEAISTLRHTISVVKMNEAMGADFAAQEGPRHAA